MSIKDEATMHVLLMPRGDDFTDDQYNLVRQISHEFSETIAGIYLEMSKTGKLRGLPGPLKVATLISANLSLLMTNLQAMPEHSRRVVAEAMMQTIDEGERRISEERREKETQQ